MSDEGRLIAGRYRVLSRIGSGAMGAVWMAQDELLHRTVAIKQLLLQSGLEENEIDDARARTMREARIAARLHHPNAISVFDVVTDDSGQPCLVMEYLESTSLAQELQGGRTLAPIDVAQIGAQVSAALKAAHAVGIVHRDIKPGNILLAPNGMVKLTDFGISRAKDDVTVTKTGMIAGTPAYLAPEVAIGGDPGPESDVFSLGSTLYAATEGQPPFGLSENTLSLLHAVAAGQINPPRQSGPLTSVLAVMLHPETEHRPTAEECEELLDAVSRGETPLGGPSDEAGEDDRTSMLGTAGAAAAGGAVGAALGAGAAGAAEEPPAGHSGTLGSDAGGYYDDGYDDYAAAGGYADHGYPDRDYDDPAYAATAYSDYDHGGYGDQDDRTRVAGAAGAGYGAYPDDPYDDPYDRDGTRVAAAAGGGAAATGEDDEKPKWKVPALVGGLVVIGLAAFAVWLFSGPKGGDDPQPAGNPAPASTTTSQTTSSPEPTTSSPEPTTEEPTYVEPEPTYEEPEPTYEEPTSSYVEPEPTTEPSPEPPPSTEEPEPTTSEPSGPAGTSPPSPVP
ncbi:serine/threonine-protein kinase [Prauserella alba]|uniref:serine/threonine-protein kinase n=1 Tax=Prauserella alba TaxID=176898 RepID=UPI0020A28030|nr:serine/threonine-protein kinase [Prauserella alba]MCP2182598.1 Serine/threonine protein kinase [Prauserella alba]